MCRQHFFLQRLLQYSVGVSSLVINQSSSVELRKQCGYIYHPLLAGPTSRATL